MQRTCIVIPCYNEFSRLNVQAFKAFVSETDIVDLLFVNDGSTDSTLSILNDLSNAFPSRIYTHNLEHNKGKAEAVRLGILYSLDKKIYDNVAFMDADLATPLNEIFNLLTAVKDKDIAISSRMKRLGAIVERKVSRHLLGRVFSTFASLILKLPVYDTQCGAKLFKSDLKYLFEDKFESKWLFDIELLARYRNKRGIEVCLGKIIEVPISKWSEIEGSKLKLKHMILVPVELMRIHLKYNYGN